MDLVKMLVDRGVRLTSVLLVREVNFKMFCDMKEYLTYEHGPNAERALAEWELAMGDGSPPRAEKIRKLLTAPSRVDSLDRCDALWSECCNQQDPDVVAALLDHGVDVNRVGGSGMTALYAVCGTERLDRKVLAIAKTLLDKGADPNIGCTGWVMPADDCPEGDTPRKPLLHHPVSLDWMTCASGRPHPAPGKGIWN